MVRELVIKKQHMGGRQTKISEFLLLALATNSAGPSNNAPRLSCSSAASEIQYEDGHQAMIAFDSNLPIIISDSD